MANVLLYLLLAFSIWKYLIYIVIKLSHFVKPHVVINHVACFVISLTQPFNNAKIPYFVLMLFQFCNTCPFLQCFIFTWKLKLSQLNYFNGNFCKYSMQNIPFFHRQLMHYIPYIETLFQKHLNKKVKYLQLRFKSNSPRLYRRSHNIRRKSFYRK